MAKYKTRSDKERHGMRRTSLYSIWSDIKKRCLDKDSMSYSNYGGRGIGFCKEWEYFSNFARDMGERKPGFQIDRIDNNGPYSKENCRWVSRGVNCANRRVHGLKNGKPRGVIKVNGRYSARIRIDQKRYYIGTFDTEKEASDNYVKVFLEWYGQNPI